MKTDPLDVPSAVDFHDPTQARAWAERTQRERPYRQAFFDRITSEVSRLAHGASHILELGSGPRFLADHILRRSPFLESYVLLDFSQAMLDASRERLKKLTMSTPLRFLRADFRDPTCTAQLQVVDAVVSMQAVHELRHKRRAPALYEQVLSILRPGGVVLICDHLPGPEADARRRALFMTAEEQLAAFRAGGFGEVKVLLELKGMALYRAVIDE